MSKTPAGKHSVVLSLCVLRAFAGLALCPSC